MAKLEVTFSEVTGAYKVVNFTIKGVKPKDRDHRTYKLVLRHYPYQRRFTLHPVNGVSRWVDMTGTGSVYRDTQPRNTLNIFGSSDPEPYTMIDEVFTSRDYTGFGVFFDYLQEKPHHIFMGKDHCVTPPVWWNEWRELLALCEGESEFTEKRTIRGYWNITTGSYVPSHSVKIPDYSVKLPEKVSKFFPKKS